MTLYLENSNVFSPWVGGMITLIVYPSVIETLWSDSDLATIGLYRPVEADPIPDGKTVTGTSVQRIGGVVKYVNTLIDTPPVVPVSQPPALLACALNVSLVDDEVQTVSGSYKIAAMFLVDVGQFMVVFSDVMPVDQPFVVPNNSVNVSISEWGDQYALLEVRDREGGTLITPSSFGFSLYNF